MNFIAPRTADSAQADANMSPSTMSAQTVLAEDTIISDFLNIHRDDDKVALFSNPLNGDREELLYIDDLNRLCWVRHSNGIVSSPGIQPKASWAAEPVAEGYYTKVVIAVHPDDSVWAFAISKENSNVDAFLLTVDAKKDAGASWVLTNPGVSMATAVMMRVQYTSDPNLSPLLILVDFASGESIPLQHIFLSLPVNPTRASVRGVFMPHQISVGVRSVISGAVVASEHRIPHRR